MPGQFIWVSTPPDIPDEPRGDPPTWPQDVLDQHGLRVLRPSEAMADPRPDHDDLRTTVYRANILLMPERLLHPVPVPREGTPSENPEAEGNPTLDAIEVFLGTIGVDLRRPSSIVELDPDAAPYVEFLADLPRPFVLTARPRAQAVDAWTVLQQIRQAVIDGQFAGFQVDAVDEVSLDHALTGTNFGPAPTGESHGLPDTVPIGTRSGYGRRPVDILLDLPDRPAKQGARRPTIVVLDTGYGSHPWFGVGVNSPMLPANGFLRTMPITQSLIDAQAKEVTGLARTDVLLSGSREDPLYTNSLTQVIAPATGHGTFIAGIIRQQAPSADVLAVRVLRSDNVAYESDVLLAMWILFADLKAKRKAGNHVSFDVLSISAGFYPEATTDVANTRIAKVVEALVAEGVVIVAAAGNDSTTRTFLPAGLAFSGKVVPAGDTRRVIGCGALNPNGSIAWFSNGGRNANCYAPGAGLISTFPDDVRGSIGPDLTTPQHDRQSLDLDDYTAGFAMWSGTSFATPVVAARLANLMLTPEDPQQVKPLGVDDAPNMISRANEAIRRLSEQARKLP